VAARAEGFEPKAYFKGLNLLLNEQHDKAIDAFIEAVQQDPDTSDLHFALGNLFRRRGEYERAVRVHEHLLKRADLPPLDRERAQHALAQDFMKAGLFDRAEEAFKALDGTVFDTEARLALLRCTSARATGAPPSRWRPGSSAAAAAPLPRASRTTGASLRWRPMHASRPPRPTPRCSALARPRRRHHGR
jgi:tetratricopeptide (TPR) repeat protein